MTWGACIQTTNFYGIDNNPFAVELAKVTLNIAKKIAFEERRELAADLNKQMELETDPSLPLDNLDKNIVCADALFTEWPDVDAIIGNPPFLGTQKFRRELGEEYLKRIQQTTGVDGVVDMACYWFRRAHDRLDDGGRAGLVGTSAIRIGKAREASLDYISAHGGTITNAVSSRIWPGEAALNVSMVNWMKGMATGPFQLIVENAVHDVPRIPTHLQLHADVSETSTIAANDIGTTMGVIFGHEAFRSGESGFSAEMLRETTFVRPVATGDDLLRGRLEQPEMCVYLAGCADERDAHSQADKAFAHLKKHVHPWLKSRAEDGKGTSDYATWFRKWWKPQKAREAFFATIAQRQRLIVCSSPQARPIFVFLSTKFCAHEHLAAFCSGRRLQFRGHSIRIALGLDEGEGRACNGENSLHERCLDDIPVASGAERQRSRRDCCGCAKPSCCPRSSNEGKRVVASRALPSLGSRRAASSERRASCAR